VLSN
jgi:hypothetical protein